MCSQSRARVLQEVVGLFILVTVIVCDFKFIYIVKEFEVQDKIEKSSSPPRIILHKPIEYQKLYIKMF